MNGWPMQTVPSGRVARLACIDARGTTLATAELDAAIGLDVPRYWYRVGCMVLAAPELRLFHRQRTLLLCNDHTGAAELSDIRVGGDLEPVGAVEAVRRLVRAAQLRLRIEGQGPGTPEPALLVELPGVRTAEGRSPFWTALGAHFYEGDPAVAAQRLGPEWRSHAAALLPREPLLVSFLQPAAQAALDRAAPGAETVLDALRAEGLRSGRYVTIDDGGPVYESPLDLLPGWRGAREVVIRADESGDTGRPCLLANASGTQFVDGRLDEASGIALATQAAVDALGAAHGARAWATPLE